MLQHYSWTQFLVFFAIISAVWYICLFLTAYRKDVLSFLAKSETIRNKGEEVELAIGIAGAGSIDNEIMGTSKLPEGLKTISMSDLSFSPSVNNGYTDDNSKSDQLGLIPDVLQELKEIFEILAREDGSKNDFLLLVEMLGEKYGRIGSHPNIKQVNEFIRERAPFAISIEELENLWD